MNHCAIHQNDVVREEMRSSFTAASTVFMPGQHLHRRGEPVVCPKPRRVGLLSGAINDPSRSSVWHLSHQAELSDSKAGSELLDIILTMGGHGSERSSTNNTTQVASSPPFFCGSPPSRVSNPLIQDTRFWEEKHHPLSSPLGSPLSPTSATARKGGCMRGNFGNSPPVRIEGFDCLDRDHRRNCSIPTVA